jgi:UDP-glucose 4-epimerase
MGMRVLVTGIGSFWGGRLAQALEADERVEVIVGIGTRPPRVPLTRTEVVRVEPSYSILSRLVAATEVDTIVHTHLEVDSTALSKQLLGEINVIGTMNLLAAAGAPDTSVRKVVVKSSTLVYGSTHRDPYCFSEGTGRSGPARTPVERSLLEAEGYLADFAEDSPETAVVLLRISNVLGPDIHTPLARALSARLTPGIAGFDPRLQFTHQDDVLAAFHHAAVTDVRGTFNVAGDGHITWSDACRLMGHHRAPISPVLTGQVARALRVTGLADLPAETLALLRYGRVVDNRAFVATGFRYAYTSAGTVEAFAGHLRLGRVVPRRRERHFFDPAVEDFFRRSPAVVRTPDPPP